MTCFHVIAYLQNAHIASLLSCTDGVPVDEEVVFISHALFAVYTILSCLGVLFVLGLLIFNLAFSKKRLFKI